MHLDQKKNKRSVSYSFGTCRFIQLNSIFETDYVTLKGIYDIVLPSFLSTNPQFYCCIVYHQMSSQYRLYCNSLYQNKTKWSNETLLRIVIVYRERFLLLFRVSAMFVAGLVQSGMEHSGLVKSTFNADLVEWLHFIQKALKRFHCHQHIAM